MVPPPAIYNVLEWQQLRLVTIQPDQWNSDIQCLLATHYVETTPPYEALSYVWGQLDGQKPIFLNSTLVSVTANLESALRHLRHEKQERTLWVDAICINQGDIAERSSQVLLMSKIYSNATQTLVWLGEANDHTAAVFRWVRQIHGFFIEWGTRVAQSQDPESLLTTPEMEAGLQAVESFMRSLPDSTEMLKQFWGNIMTRPWFKRVWVVQEIVLAKKGTLQCGDSSVPWNVLSEAFYMMATTQFAYLKWNNGTVDSIDPKALDCDSEGFLQLIYQYRSYGAGQRLPISTIVGANSLRKATDPKDLVYAFIGLAAANESPILKPDYSNHVSAGDVYQTLVQYAIAVEKSLDVLSRNEATPRNQGSTWCPQWPSIVKCTVLNPGAPHPILSKYMVDEIGNLTPEFQASGDLVPQAAIDSHSGILICGGILVDFVTDHGKAMNVDISRPENLPVFDLCQWEEILLKKFGNRWVNFTRGLVTVADTVHLLFHNAMPIQSHPFIAKLDTQRMLKRSWRIMTYPTKDTPYIGGGCVVEAYVRTLCTDRTAAHEKMTDEAYESFWACSMESPSTDRAARLQGQTVGANIQRSITQRSLLVTERGYIGLGPSKVEDGDLITIIYGCSVPLVLRKKGDHYILIGEAYVHGLMHGEAPQQLNEGKVMEMNFELH